jgi:hypothetical protein
MSLPKGRNPLFCQRSPKRRASLKEQWVSRSLHSTAHRAISRVFGESCVRPPAAICMTKDLIVIRGVNNGSTQSSHGAYS